MSLAFEQYNSNEGSVTSKKKKKAKVPVNKEAMKYGYIDMESILKEDAAAWEGSWNDGMKLYNDNPNAPW